LLAAALLSAAGASAAPGMADDPLVTKEYLEQTYIPSILQKAEAAVAARFAGRMSQADALRTPSGAQIEITGLDAVRRKVMSRINLYAAAPFSLTLPKGATLTVGLGASVILLSGGAELKGGVFVDASEGRDASGALQPQHLYLSLAGESSLKASGDATVVVQGGYRVTPAYLPQYTDLCEALIKMGIVNTYELERESSRLEMMVIFLVLLGVRAESDAYAGTHPFTDVPAWADRNVAYLFSNGYVTGTGGDKLDPTRPASVQQTCFLMLKALGYADGADITFATALDDAVRYGLFTPKELALLQSDDYTRDTLMYRTYYARFAGYKTGGRVIDRLIALGLVDRAAFEAATVARQRPM
jgi:hypothetical protein